MLKNKAKQLREITDKAIADTEQKIAQKSKNYVHNLIINKCQKSALKGHSVCEVKIKKPYNSNVIAEELQLMGFEIKKISVDGKQKIRVKW